MRLIDADAITKTKELTGKLFIHDMTPYISVEDLINFIDELPTVNEWIPCSEKLPDNEVEVEVTIELYLVDKPYNCITDFAFYEDGTMNEEDSMLCLEEGLFTHYDDEKEVLIIKKGWYREERTSESICMIKNEEKAAYRGTVIAWKPKAAPYM